MLNNNSNFKETSNTLNSNNYQNFTKSLSKDSNITNLLNVASQIGDDWSSLNNYLTNFLKKINRKES